MYYGFISISTVLFSLMFVFSRRYEKECGNSLNAALKFTAGSFTAGLIVLLIINKFRIEFTPVTLAFALCAALDNILFNFFSIKSLGKINLSLYSMFSMLGGMALPFIAGIAFFDEDLTVGKTICFISIVIAMALSVEKGEKKSGYIYYAGVFICNGLSGVIPKFYTECTLPKASDAGYSILIAACVVVMSLICLPFTGKEKAKLTFRSVLCMAGNGAFSNIGNYLQLLAFAVIPASTISPFISGGIIILSTIYSYFTPDKPSRKQIAGVIFSTVGIAALFIFG